MAKKSNKPFKRYISVINNKELYEIGKLLTEKEMFKLSQEETEAIATTSPEVFVKITEYDIIKNPAILLQTTSKQEVVKKIKERIDNLDSLTRDVYSILFSHWFEYKDELGYATIEIDDMHFNYRGHSGKNISSTLSNDDYENYRKCIDILRNTSVKIDINDSNNFAYHNIKDFDVGAVEGFLLNVDNFIYYSHDNTKIKGLKYKLSVIQDISSYYTLQVDNKFSTSILKMAANNPTMKNLGYYISKLRKINVDSGNTYTDISIYNLMGESNFKIVGSRYQQYINRFLDYLRRTEEILRDDEIVTQIDIPFDVDSKTYKFKKVRIYWNLDVIQDVQN